MGYENQWNMLVLRMQERKGELKDAQDPSESTCFRHTDYSLHGVSSIIAQIPHRQIINFYSELLHCSERIFASSLELHCFL